MVAVGLTGGIASGKSFVIKYLKKKKIPTHDSDEVVMLIYKKPPKDFLDFLQDNGFKKSLIKKEINKKIIRNEIFENKNKKIKLEKYLHSKVKKSREIFLKKNKRKKIFFLDIPLLFENNLQNTCLYVCSTIAPLKVRKMRALKRPGMKKKILNAIIKAQVSDTIRREESNYIINTSKTKTNTYLQVDSIIEDVLKKQV